MDVEALSSRLKKLREVLGLSQERYAELGGIRRLDVLAIEAGKKFNSHDVRKGLARAAGVTTDEMDEYLDGAMSLEAIMTCRIRRSERHARGEPRSLSERAMAMPAQPDNVPVVTPVPSSSERPSRPRSAR